MSENSHTAPDYSNEELIFPPLINKPISGPIAVQGALHAMQQKFAMIQLHGVFYTYDRQKVCAFTDKGAARKFQPLKRTDASLLITREVAKLFPRANAKQIAREFFTSPQTCCYEGVEFNPGGVNPKILNLWVPPTVVPAKGGSKLIRDFLRKVICGGNKDNYDFLMRLLAHALQLPWEKPGVMVILLGGQGTGKGTFARILCKIWSATYLQVHQIKSITGDFNASLERAFIVWLDEAFFEKNRAATDSLKSLVTEPVIYINEKFQPARQISSFHRFFGASNSDFYKPTDRDDRRDFVLRVSDKCKGDHEYWMALNHEIENGGVEALAHVLLKADLSSFNVREKPNTSELMRQKLKSLTPVQQWWFDCLSHGADTPGGVWPSFISTDSAIKGVYDISGGKAAHKPAAIEMAKLLKDFCPSALKKQLTLDGARQRGFLLPSLKKARSEFASYMGGEITW